jgi:hypothetical protein
MLARSRSKFGMALGLIAAAVCLGTTAICRADDYPAIFTSATELKKTGLYNPFGDDTNAALKNKCYYYGDGGYAISLSDEFLARFLRQGFTLQSACLGLISTTHYDPETGRRLATYMVIDKKSVAKRAFDDGAATEELPFELPPCFKNANPYGDCTFRYGRITGKQLTDAQTNAYKQLGAAVDAVMAKAIQGIPDKEELYGSGDGEELIKGFRKQNGDNLPADIDEPLRQYSSFSIWVRSSKFPHGYGYALDADGAAGPSLSAQAMNAAINGLSKSQISADAIKRALDASHN